MAVISIALSFTGKAEAAMNFYEKSLPDAKIKFIARYGSDHPMAKAGNENKILHGVLSLGEKEIKFMDMVDEFPAPDFTWATSIYTDCKDEDEFDAIFKPLSDGGLVMMGPEAVGPMRKVAWVTDKFNVTWQIVWA
jgi:predicted 3-demethylubiquinone-9 3-methyltransferase (glyoxalase superfamily)